MNETKKNKIIIASTVGAVLFVLILLFVMIFQIISIVIAKNQDKEYKLAISEYERTIDQAESTLKERKGKTWIVMRAKELGYTVPGSKS